MNPKTNEHEKQLVSLLKANNVNAFDSLFYKYSKNVFNYSFSILKNSDDSKEIVQEVFYRIWNNRSSLDSTKSFKSFLYTITYRLIIDQIRIRLKKKEYISYLLVNMDSEFYIVNNNSDYTLLTEKIEHAVEELPEKRKKIYKLSRENGYSYLEIANEMGITTKTVENQINLALKFLKLRIGINIAQYY